MALSDGHSPSHGAKGRGLWQAASGPRPLHLWPLRAGARPAGRVPNYTGCLPDSPRRQRGREPRHALPPTTKRCHTLSELLHWLDRRTRAQRRPARLGGPLALHLARPKARPRPAPVAPTCAAGVLPAAALTGGGPPRLVTSHVLLSKGRSSYYRLRLPRQNAEATRSQRHRQSHAQA